MAECRGIVAKTASKVSTDLRSWDLFVEEQGQTIGEYPTEAQAVAFAIWLSMRRERVCLAQRVGPGPRLTVCREFRISGAGSASGARDTLGEESCAC